MKSMLGVIIVLLVISVLTGTIEQVFHNTNELISTVSAYVQTGCIVLQSYLIYKQFKLSKEIEEKSRAENKGIFVLDNTNIKNRYKNKEWSNNKYDLRESISFHNVGNDHIIVKRSKNK